MATPLTDPHEPELEPMVAERTGAILSAAVRLAIERAAETFAQEALQDENLRRLIRELVHRQAGAWLAQLLTPPERNGGEVLK